MKTLKHRTNSLSLSLESKKMGSRSSAQATALFFSLVLLISSANSFYHASVPPRAFQKGDLLDVKVNKLSSAKTQLRYDHYDLRYCRPCKIMNDAETWLETLGELLRGDRIQNSMYTFHMREEQPCEVLCRIVLGAESAKDFKEKIDDEYRVNLILDDLPVAAPRQERDGNQSTITYAQGFSVGFKGNYLGSNEEKYFINNHLSFRVKFHRHLQNDSAQIVGFEVTPISINHEYKEFPQVTTCNQHTKHVTQGSYAPQEIDTDKEILFTYDVSFMESDIKWESRWDRLNKNDESQQFSVVNALLMNLL